MLSNTFYIKYIDCAMTIPTHKYYTKLNTQVYHLVNDYVAEKYQQECREALFFIGECAESIPGKRKSFTGTLETWNNGTIHYTKRMFGYVPRNPDPEFAKLLEITFSPTMVNQIFGCIGEFMIFLYYVYKSKPELEEKFKMLRARVNYAVEKYDTHDSFVEEERRARYLWELCTGFSLLNDVIESKESERKYCLPKSHTFSTTMLFSYISEFGCYSTFESGSDDYYLHEFPRCSTKVSSKENALFFIPSHTEVREECTKYLQEALNTFKKIDLSKTTMQADLFTLIQMNSYKSKYLVSNRYEIRSNDYKSFENRDSAKKFVKEDVKFEKIDDQTIYYMLKVKVAEDDYKLMLFTKNKDGNVISIDDETTSVESVKEESVKEEQK